jgi:hypothetical protein
MNIVNTTPHEINIYMEEQTEWNEERKFYQVKEGELPVKSIPSSGTTFRMDMQEATITSLVLRNVDLYSPHLREEDSFNFGTPVMRVWYDGHDEFPNEVEGTYYIVSRLVAENAKDRDDFLMVHRTVRDSDGRIIGCTAFATASETFGIGEEE